MGRDERVGQAGELFDVGSQLTGAQGAIQPHDQRSGVADGVPERLDRVPREGPAAGIGDRARDPERHLDAKFREDALDRVDGRLGVEHVEDRLDHQQVHAAHKQPVRGLGVGRGQLFEGDGSGGRVGNVRGYGGRLVRRPERPGDEPRPPWLQRLRGIRRSPRDPGRLDVDLVGNVLQPIVGLGDARGGERVGRDDVGAGSQVRVMDRANHVGTGKAQQVVVAADVARVVAEALAAEVGLGQAVTLDEGARGSVEHENPPLQQGAEQEQAFLTRPGRMGLRRRPGIARS